MRAANAALTVAAMVTLGGCPPSSEDCHHPDLPHIADVTGAPPWCHAATPDGCGRCTLPALHDGPHLAGNGDWITASWEPDSATDWQWWTPSDGAATRWLAVLSWVISEGPGGYITSGGFQWFPPHDRDVLPAAAVAAYQREVADAATATRVRLLHLPVPAGIAERALDSDQSARQVVTDWLDARTEEIEVHSPAVCEAIVTPDDPEPQVQVIVQKQYTNRRGDDVDAAEPQIHEANAALRDTPREVVATLRDNDYTSDEFVLAHGWLGGHRGGFYARFDGDAIFDDEGDMDGTPGIVTRWLAWSERWRHLLGSP